MMFFKILQHLLPNARAWNLTVDKKLRQFFEGLSPLGDAVRAFFDLIIYDIDPSKTRELSAWEDQFGLRSSGILTEAERRARLDAAWKAIGGQDPKYIQDTLRSAGFDVYVHEWWVPGTEPAVNAHATATVRNPLTWLRRGYTSLIYSTECGEPLAQCGEPIMKCGESPNPRGYPLANKVYEKEPNLITLCGEPLMECGEPTAEAGNYFGYNYVIKNYLIPLDPIYWPYFLYIGGQTFGTLAQVTPPRKDEFEELCLKIAPCQQWLGMLVEYV